MHPRRVIEAVWGNDSESNRYVPRALEPGKSARWRVYDKVEARFVADRELKSIDPSERIPTLN